MYVREPSNEMALIACKRKWSRIASLLRRKLYEICFEAVKNDGLALMYVPTEFKTKELCLQAVSQNGLALQFVPVQLID